MAKFTPFPGAPLYKDIKKYGSFDENWELMNCTNFVFVAKNFTKERLEERYKEFYTRHFGRFHILFDYVTMIWRSPESWLRFILNLKDFLMVRSSFRKSKKTVDS